MTLDEILKTVSESMHNDWNKVNVRTLAGFSVSTRYSKKLDEPILEVEPTYHDDTYVYKPDIDITLTFGDSVVKNFVEPWSLKFAGQPSESVKVWILYRGVPVYSTVAVYVDDNQYLIPIPKSVGGKYQVDKQSLDFKLGNLLFSLTSLNNHFSFEDVLLQAEIVVT